jgi:hypothetical protein
MVARLAPVAHSLVLLEETQVQDQMLEVNGKVVGELVVLVLRPVVPVTLMVAHQLFWDRVELDYNRL